jgi:hypothetical protein
MTDNAGKAFDSVEPVLQASMRRHGITAEDYCQVNNYHLLEKRFSDMVQN